MKKFIIILLIGFFSSCVGVIEEAKVEVKSVSNCPCTEFKYRVELSSKGGTNTIVLYTDTYYVVGEKVEIIQK